MLKKARSPRKASPKVTTSRIQTKGTYKPNPQKMQDARNQQLKRAGK